jgi:uncharacterized protein YndB with AHSA1/START domain
MTVPLTHPAGCSLSIGRLIRAPGEEVFDAWLNPNLLRLWMKPQPQVVVVEALTNPIVGGTFRIVMRANGRDESHEGVYHIIDRPHRLSFSWVSVPAGPDSHVDISFLVAAEEQTMVLLKHERLASPSATENHREGWRRILDSLAHTLEGLG